MHYCCVKNPMKIAVSELALQNFVDQTGKVVYLKGFSQKSLEVEVAAIHNVERVSLELKNIQKMNIVRFGLRY